LKVGRLVISRSRVVFLLIFTFLLACYGNVTAGEPSHLKGKVTDLEGKPVEDAVVFIYQDTNTRRQPDYMSPKSDREGRFDIPLPPGRYWAVARVKKGEGTGPILPGGRHSGEPVEIEIAGGRDFEKDFVVADIRELARMSKRTKEEVISITGRIVDSSGMPVKMAYAIANKNNVPSEMPDYLSGWTDETGYFAMHLPRGRYYIGCAATFPPGKSQVTYREIIIEADTADVNILIDQP
jgi:uncharacterized GH25 family protein